MEDGGGEYRLSDIKVNPHESKLCGELKMQIEVEFAEFKKKKETKLAFLEKIINKFNTTYDNYKIESNEIIKLEYRKIIELNFKTIIYNWKYLMQGDDGIYTKFYTDCYRLKEGLNHEFELEELLQSVVDQCYSFEKKLKKIIPRVLVVAGEITDDI